MLPDISAVYDRGLDRVAQHAPLERDWRADDLQEAAAISLRVNAGRRERGELPDPWLGHNRGEQHAHQWLQAKSVAIESCRTGLAFVDQQCGLGVFLPSSCHVRGCPRCERARSSRLLERFELPAKGCPSDCAVPAHVRPGGAHAKGCPSDCAVPAHVRPGGAHLPRMRQPKVLTLTMPNVGRGELAGAADQLRRGFRRMRQRALFRGGACRTRGWAARHAEWLAEHGRTSCLLEPAGSRGVRCHRRGEHRRCGRYRHERVAGGVWAIETTYNLERDTWHVHMHVLLEGPYLERAEVADVWRQVVLRGDDCRRCGRPGGECACSYVVDIRPVRCKRCKLTPNRCRCGPDGLVAALREVLKYVGKPTDDPDRADRSHRGGAAVIDARDPDRYAELVLSWYGQRLVSGFGAWAALPDLHEPLDREAVTFVAHPHDPYAGWYLPRRCPWCEREASWSNHPRLVSRLEAVRHRDRARAGPPGRPPPLLWHEPPVLV